MINLGEKIKELRLRDGRTQDVLASELGVTAQAVSRWEKGICFPDMEIVPSIANYFGVSIDELFRYDNERSKKVDALAKKINDMIWQNNGKDVNMDKCIALARESLIEFPGNEKLTLALASSLYNAGYVRYGEFHIVNAEGFGVYDIEKHKTYSEWQEAIKLYEKLLLSLPDGDMRQKTITELSQLYKNTGAHEKALALADSAPDITGSKPFLRIKAFDGKEAIVAQREALLSTINQSSELIVHIVLSDTTLKPDAAAAMLQNAEELFALIIPDHRYGNNFGFLACVQMLRSYYLWLADKEDDAFAALDVALGYAKEVNNSFAEELPELWPWWDVPEIDKIKAEIQSDSRWKKWVKRTEK
ncbi:MAG: helix-turn-helix transcriptional regulator [Lachnospiraceae bacterium]|nr:helix-turn-helix transcriptional regulator [Lachnospiraceae bacterium]